MRVFIQQPYYLPWLGFFSKLLVADCYVALDDAGYRRNYLGRVRLLGPSGDVIWINIPTGASRGCPMSSVKLPSDLSYLKRTLSTIRHSYRRARFFDQEFHELEILLLQVYTEAKGKSLACLNLELITRLVSHIGGKPPKICLASSVVEKQERTGRTISICKALGADQLIVGDGGALQCHDVDLIGENNIRLFQLPFYRLHPQYNQCRKGGQSGEFCKGLSIIDAILNLGRSQTLSLIKSIQPIEICL